MAITDAEVSAAARAAYDENYAVTRDQGCAIDAAHEAVACLVRRTGFFDDATLTWTSDGEEKAR